MELPTANTADDFLKVKGDEMKPTMAARIMAGPKLFAGAVTYIMTARKINASATDLLVWLVPSTLAIGTVKRPDAIVSTTRMVSGIKPLQPRNGSRKVEISPVTSSKPAAIQTATRSERAFQFSLGMCNFSRYFELAGFFWGFRSRGGPMRQAQMTDSGQHCWPVPE